MRNKYGGTCYRCGRHVKPGDGHFERYKGGWRVQHANCATKNREQEPFTKNEGRQVVSYRKMIAWVAMNDEPLCEDIEEIKVQISVVLIADTFEKEPEAVAKAILRFRQKEKTL